MIKWYLKTEYYSLLLNSVNDRYIDNVIFDKLVIINCKICVACTVAVQECDATQDECSTDAGIIIYNRIVSANKLVIIIHEIPF
jgi:hypothetical protein